MVEANCKLASKLAVVVVTPKTVPVAVAVTLVEVVNQLNAVVLL